MKFSLRISMNKYCMGKNLIVGDLLGSSHSQSLTHKSELLNFRIDGLFYAKVIEIRNKHFGTVFVHR